MTSTRGWSSSAGRSGSVTARTTRATPRSTTATPIAPTTRPRRAQGRDRGGAGMEILRHVRDDVGDAEGQEEKAEEDDEEPALDADPGGQPAAEVHLWRGLVTGSRRAVERAVSSSTVQLPVKDVDGSLTRGPEPGGQLLDEHDRSMLPAGAADRDRQATLALGGVGGNREGEEVLHEREEAGRPRLGKDVLPDRRGEPGALAELFDVIGVPDEPGIEDEVRLERQAGLVAEAQELERHLVGLDVAEAGEKPLAKPTEGQVPGVHHDLGFLSDGIEEAALVGDRRPTPSP